MAEYILKLSIALDRGFREMFDLQDASVQKV